MHLAGNILILAGPDTFNHYAQVLAGNPAVVYTGEVLLVVTLLVHIFKGVAVVAGNMRARPHRYAVRSNHEKKTTVASRTLIAQGAVILFFLINHLAMMKFGPVYNVNLNGSETRDLYKLVSEIFHKPAFVAWYVVALLILSLHLGHGFYSSFQSLGINNPKIMGFLRKAGYLYDALITVGFVIIPIYVYLH
jgi:succinate dehydrogenase / fumarate reductase, cytochrome b subunit